ncbi:DNA cytosine methyltransferase [Klebsiella pneumoniae]|nr:DNA cytosine methyltransferase [Klebsiella pneumoniae subsp. pneumoniae]
MRPVAYYNEIDPFAAEWLRNLIAGGYIAPGEVDERSIEDVTPGDLRGFTQCHFFAGIGGWSYALRLAGWPDNKQIWTGSCPCQPFSQSGKGLAFDDPRHLWPDFSWLIKQRKPKRVVGEQSASGRANAWFDLVQNDLEKMGYAFGLIPFPSACVGAPHERERAYWVADAHLQHESTTRDATRFTDTCGRCPVGWMADTNHDRQQSGSRPRGSKGQTSAWNDLRRSCENAPGPTNGFWKEASWLPRRDELWCPTEPGTFPLVDGVSTRLGRVQPSVSRMAGRNRAGRIRGYGNAVNVYAAAEFIRAYMDRING